MCCLSSWPCEYSPTERGPTPPAQLVICKLRNDVGGREGGMTHSKRYLILARHARQEQAVLSVGIPSVPSGPTSI